MRILNSDEVRRAEREAVGHPGMSTLVLMQRAGTAVAQFCRTHFEFNSVCVVCGKGNNGGDGLVAAEALRPIAGKISVIILAQDVNGLSPDAAAMCSRLNLEPIWVTSPGAFDGDEVRQVLTADLIIDAVVGTGFKPPLRGLPQRAVQAMNDAAGAVVSVDLPSGVDADLSRPAHKNNQEMVFAHGIITFVAPKPAHVFGELTSGPIAVSEIGVPTALVPNQTCASVVTGQAVGIAFPPRPRDANKGHFGHVLVIAGSQGKAGAASMAGMAALRTGAGLVTVACPRSIQDTVAGFAPEMMTEGLEETDAGSIALAARSKVEQLLLGKDAVVLGPGISRNPGTAEFVRWLVAHCPVPLVLDADGLNAFDGRYDELKPRGEAAAFRVLTPHPGEAARLLSIPTQQIQSDRMEIARRLSRDTGSCVVLKGARTIVAGFSDETWINLTGNPALAKGGSGDVLSGMIAAALARETTGLVARKPAVMALTSPAPSAVNQDQTPTAAHLTAFLSVVRVAAAVHLHGLAADLARDRAHENTVLATDLFGSLPDAFRECDLQKESALFQLQT
jgi:NAD(P)H-hydrate epimerase